MVLNLDCEMNTLAWYFKNYMFHINLLFQNSSLSFYVPIQVKSINHLCVSFCHMMSIFLVSKVRVHLIVSPIIENSAFKVLISVFQLFVMFAVQGCW